MEDVVERSRNLPVVVDFWAPWCGPCKSLLPILEGLTEKYNGAFHLAKINIDENQEIAMQFSVRSVPAVFMIKDGTVVDGFMGAQPKSNIEQFLAKHVSDPRPEAISNDPDDTIAKLVNQGNIKQAISILQGDSSDTGLLRLADLYLMQHDFENAQATLDKISESENSKPSFKSTSAKLEFIKYVATLGDVSELEKRVVVNSEDWDAKYKLAIVNLVNGNSEIALENLLEIVKLCRSFNDDLARKGLVKAFEFLGPDNELVPKFRRLLANILN